MKEGGICLGVSLGSRGQSFFPFLINMITQGKSAVTFPLCSTEEQVSKKTRNKILTNPWLSTSPSVLSIYKKNKAGYS